MKFMDGFEMIRHKMSFQINQIRDKSPKALSQIFFVTAKFPKLKLPCILKFISCK